ncbi:hypothetical protein E4T56_gene10198 [Termitomyces sp. T112]|nr:hypothetical protein E4T56_gene10198 [Termitomyces sp. T112]
MYTSISLTLITHVASARFQQRATRERPLGLAICPPIPCPPGPTRSPSRLALSSKSLGSETTSLPPRSLSPSLFPRRLTQSSPWITLSPL